MLSVSVPRLDGTSLAVNYLASVVSADVSG